MKYLQEILCLLALISGGSVIAQDSTGLSGTPFTEKQLASGEKSPYLLSKWYSGSIRMADDKVYEGVQMRYDLVNDEIEFKKDSALYHIAKGVQEFTLPSGTDLYIFRSGFPAVDKYSNQSFYRILYDGETKLLKKYQSPITVEKASATREMDPDAKLYILKGDKLNPVSLKDKNSFLKLLSEEKNKMRYVIKEEGLEFDGDDDLGKLLEEFDSYKAGRGGN